MATLDRINKYAEYLLRDAKRNARVYLEKRTALFEDEKSYIAKHNICDANLYKKRYLPRDKLKNFLETGFGDANVLYTLMCIINTIFERSSNYRQFNISPRFLTKQIFHEGLRQIGGESYSSYALASNSFIVKASKKPITRGNEIIHEYFIGAFGTNTLRSAIPHFAFMLGHFTCSPPLLERKEKKVITYCQSTDPDQQTAYLLYENIQPSVSLGTILKDISLQDFLKYFLQVIFALGIAANKFGFRHNDLHADNVLIRETKSPLSIHYRIKGTDYYINTDRIATIIDLERGEITYDNKIFGHYHARAGILPGKTGFVNDIFHFLCSCLTVAFFGTFNPGIVNESDLTLKRKGKIVNPNLLPLVRLLELFGAQSQGYYLNYLASISKHYFVLPPEVKFSGIKVTDWIFENFGDLLKSFLSQEPKHSVYGCEARGDCQKNPIKKLPEYPNGISNVYEWFDYYTIDQKEALKILPSFREQYTGTLEDEYLSLSREYSKLLEGYTLVRFSDLLRGIKFEEALSQYRPFIETTFYLLTLLRDLTDIRRVYSLINKKHGLPEVDDDLVRQGFYAIKNDIPLAAKQLEDRRESERLQGLLLIVQGNF